MKFVAILSLVIVVADDVLKCPSFVCDPSDVTWNEGVCAMQNATNNFQYFLKTSECDSDQLCPILKTIAEGGTSTACIPTNNTSSPIALPGERCDILHTCVTGICTEEGTCPVPPTCVNPGDCPPGKFCNSQATCESQVVIAGTCNADTDCVNNAKCDQAVGTAGKCIRYGSVAGGAALQACTGATATMLVPHGLCASGFCYAPTATTFACSGALTTNGTLPMNTTTYGVNCVSNEDTTSKCSLTQTSECGYDGYAYCPLFTGDPDYADYASDIQAYLSNPGLVNCNTQRHVTAFQYSSGFNWCAQNITESQSYHYLRAINYAAVFNATSCVLKVLNPEYYQAEGGAESLFLSGLLLALLQ